MDKEIMEFQNWLAKRQQSWKAFNPNAGTKLELHHLIGKKASDLVLALGKNWHDFISSRQNSLSRTDKNQLLIMMLESIAALLDLAAALLRWIAFKLREEP